MFLGNNGYKKAPGSFLFSLKNIENFPPFKAPLKDQNTTNAIYAKSSLGPTSGKGHDLRIYNYAVYATSSYTNFDSYKVPSGVRNVRTILTRSFSFTPSEVEVFYLV